MSESLVAPPLIPDGHCHVCHVALPPDASPTQLWCSPKHGNLGRVRRYRGQPVAAPTPFDSLLFQLRREIAQLRRQLVGTTRLVSRLRATRDDLRRQLERKTAAARADAEHAERTVEEITRRLAEAERTVLNLREQPSAVPVPTASAQPEAEADSAETEQLRRKVAELEERNTQLWKKLDAGQAQFEKLTHQLRLAPKILQDWQWLANDLAQRTRTRAPDTREREILTRYFEYRKKTQKPTRQLRSQEAPR
jgi:predicted RNase H-like nuclease (RuvC/YqgF family)